MKEVKMVIKRGEDLYPDSLVDISKIEPGTVLRELDFMIDVNDGRDEITIFKMFILRGGAGITAYVGFGPKLKVLMGKKYIEGIVDNVVHGGSTYNALGFRDRTNTDWLPYGYKWIGWDYAHCMDARYMYGVKEGMEALIKKIKKDIKDTSIPLAERKRLKDFVSLHKETVMKDMFDNTGKRQWSIADVTAECRELGDALAHHLHHSVRDKIKNIERIVLVSIVAIPAGLILARIIFGS